MSVHASAGHGSELNWFKSSYSTNDGPDCVEVAITPKTIHVRDSKNLTGPQLTFDATGWAAFVSYTTKH
ncbi:DUF397 domain-containing protein [Streptomyces sp. NPDC048664]|uniref:DUF397 domain-containing protein n=1 Tax=Streptomyces sp. NPDC048664 TaxID=3154505 RepID=UPI0034378CD0